MFDDDITSRARRRTRRLAVLVAVAGLAVVVTVAGLIIALGHRTAPVPQAATHRADPSPSGYPSHTLPSPAVPPPATAADLSWVTVAGAQVPVSLSAGPRDTSGGRAREFSDTPLGAVLAAAHITLRLCPQVGPEVFEPTAREQVVGADAATLMSNVEDAYQVARAQLGVPYGAPAGRLYSTATGYRVSVAGDTAHVDLLIEGPGSSGSVLISLPLDLIWSNGDWALVAPKDGSWDAIATVTTDATGYSQFSDGG